MDLNGDMIRGHIDTIILLSLVDGDKDSNEIRKNIEDRSDNKFSVKQGTFYSAMQRLVKQSLIKEYRSSATDGIRRKYFSLTEKGEKLVENNRKEWLESKEVIDTLVDTVQEKPENDLMMRTEDFPIPSENPYESPVLSAENDQKIDEKSIENLPEDAYDTHVTVHNETETQSEDDLLQDINAKLSDILGELGFENDKPDNENANNETFVEKNTSENVSKLQENKALPNAKINERRSYPFEITDSSLYVEDETDFNPTVEITVNHDETIRETEPEINVTDEVETADQNNEKPFIFDDNIEENEPIENIAQTENVTCETVEETNVSIDENPSETQTANDTNATFEYTAQEDKAANDEYSDEEDDLLAVEDGTTSNRREYKSILSSLFPKKEEKHATTEIETDNSEERTERNEQTRYFDDDYSPARSETDGYYEENVSSGRYPSDDETAEIANEKTDRRQQTYYDGEGSTDFSDLYNMAKREKLYSLYLTYLPTDKFKYALKMNVDNRGSFTELVHTADCGQVSINISRPGVTKGQHWHNSKWELFIVVAGHGLIQERNINTGETVEFEVSGDKIEAVHMIPGWTHNIINLSETENLVTVMTCNEIFNPNHPDTFFEPV